MPLFKRTPSGDTGSEFALAALSHRAGQPVGRRRWWRACLPLGAGAMGAMGAAVALVCQLHTHFPVCAKRAPCDSCPSRPSSSPASPLAQPRLPGRLRPQEGPAEIPPATGLPAPPAPASPGVGVSLQQLKCTLPPLGWGTLLWYLTHSLHTLAHLSLADQPALSSIWRGENWRP